MLSINVSPCQLKGKTMSCSKHLNFTGCRLTVKFCIETDSATYTVGLLYVASVINAVPVHNTGHYTGMHYIIRPFAAEQVTSLLHNH